jgi:2-polyprenyl-3-methyl-5-hydroxy-6-metoxy-1,4-benzoquinol methylase
MRTKLYEPAANRLLYLDREADETFWDDKWEKSAGATFANPPRHGATMRITRRYLPDGSRVLEGGCGLGDIVHALDRAGFRATGVDFAPKVVDAINRHWPHLNVLEGDVRALPCEDGAYDGYWSIGVIEHFPEGYDAIASEMQRVLRPGGILFLSFPSFNAFRQKRAAAGKYELLQSSANPVPDFYQFALDPSDVRQKFENLGFELVSFRGLSSLLGLAEDSAIAAAVQSVLNRCPDRAGSAVSLVLDSLIGKYAGHSCLLILRRTDLTK